MLLRLHADHGTETALAANAYYFLRQQLRAQDDSQELSFSDCFRYGTSKKNQRIEAW